MAFRFWVDDFDGGTSYMTNEEVGVYLRLLIYQFRNGSIPKTIFDRMTRGLTTVEAVIEKFQVVDGCYVQHRMDEIRKDSIQFSEKQSIKGKKSASKRSNSGSTVDEPSGSGRGSGSDSSSLGIGGVGEKGFYANSINDEVWQESVMRTCKISDPVKWINEFYEYVKATQDHHNTITDWRRHCVNWIKSELKKTKQDVTKKSAGEQRMDGYRDWFENA